MITWALAFMFYGAKVTSAEELIILAIVADVIICIGVFAIIMGGHENGKTD